MLGEIKYIKDAFPPTLLIGLHTTCPLSSTLYTWNRGNICTPAVCGLLLSFSQHNHPQQVVPQDVWSRSPTSQLSEYWTFWEMGHSRSEWDATPLPLFVAAQEPYRSVHLWLNINGEEVERLSRSRFLETHICEDLPWTDNTAQLIKRHNNDCISWELSGKSTCLISCCLFTAAPLSVLTHGILIWWGNSSVADKKALQRVTKTAQKNNQYTAVWFGEHVQI